MDTETITKNKRRLTAAFREIRRSGVIARQNCGFSNSDARYLLDDLAQEAKSQGKTVIGGVYYHAQDREDMAERGHLNVGYGALDSDGMSDDDVEAAYAATARIALAALQKEGLKATWSGDTNTRIVVDMAAEPDQS